MSKCLTRVDFHPLELDDRKFLEPFLLNNSPGVTGYTFACLMEWKRVFHYEWSFISDDCVLINAIVPPDQRRVLVQPIGDFSPECRQSILDQFAELDYRGRMYNVCAGFLEKYTDFVQHFEVIEDRGRANYIYLAEDLAGLPGRKYSKKRNLISQAGNAYQWLSAPIRDADLAGCIELLEEICFEKQIESDANLLSEWMALDYCLHHFSALSQQGRLIRVGGKTVAFSVYEKLNEDTVVVHFEKALQTYKGLYQLINRETALSVKEEGYRYINREEDIDLPGLRKAKMSYYPVELKPSYRLVYKSQK